MLKSSFKLVVLLIVAGLGLFSCANNRTVSRISADQRIDLSGRWNDTDAQLVARNMIQDLTSRPWIAEFKSENDRKPVVITGDVKNQTSEHIATSSFMNDIQRELINSGKVKFVANKNDRKEIRQERLEQQQYSSEETAKRLAAETGADFILKGKITSTMDSYEGKQVKYYQVDLELINVESNDTIWMGTKKIKKFVETKKYKF